MTTEQRLSTLERKMDNLMKTIANLSIRQSTSHNNNESNISNADGKAEMVGARVDEAEDNISMNEDALNFVTEEVLPSQNENIDEIGSTVDYILTEVLPTIMVDEE